MRPLQSKSPSKKIKKIYLFQMLLYCFVFQQLLAMFYIEGVENIKSIFLFGCLYIIGIKVRNYFIGDRLLYFDQKMERSADKPNEVHLFGILITEKEVAKKGERKLMGLLGSRYYSSLAIAIPVGSLLALKYLPHSLGVPSNSLWLLYFSYLGILLACFQLSHFLLLGFTSLLTIFFYILRLGQLNIVGLLPFLIVTFMILSIYRHIAYHKEDQLGPIDPFDYFSNHFKNIIKPAFIFSGLVFFVQGGIQFLSSLSDPQAAEAQAQAQQNSNAPSFSRNAATHIDRFLNNSSSGGGGDSQSIKSKHLPQGSGSNAQRGGASGAPQGRASQANLGSLSPGGGRDGEGGSQGQSGGFQSQSGEVRSRQSSSQNLQGEDGGPQANQIPGEGSGESENSRSGRGSSGQRGRRKRSNRVAASPSSSTQGAPSGSRSGASGKRSSSGGQRGPDFSSMGEKMDSKSGPKSKQMSAHTKATARPSRNRKSSSGPERHSAQGTGSGGSVNGQQLALGGSGGHGDQGKGARSGESTGVSKPGRNSELDQKELVSEAQKIKSDASARVEKLSNGISSILNFIEKFAKLFFFGLFGYFLFLFIKAFNKKSKKEDLEEHIELSSEMKKFIRRKESILGRSQLSPEREVIKSYQFFIETMSYVNFSKDPWLPVKDYQEKTTREYSQIEASAETFSELYCECYYGKKNVSQDQLFRLRKARKAFVQKMVS